MKQYPTTVVDSCLWKQFAAEIGKRKGTRRGAIQESLEEAILLWIGEEHEG